MNKLEKLVPAAVAGLVIASAGTLEAQAVENVDPNTPENVNTADQQKETAAPSTEIKSAVGEPKTDPQTGVTTTDMTVNPDTKETEDGAAETTDNGAVTKTETTNPTDQEPEDEHTTSQTTETREDGSTVQTTVTEKTEVNGDGSATKTETTTTVTTGTNEDGDTVQTTESSTTETTTSSSTTEIGGEVTSDPVTGGLTDEEKAEQSADLTAGLGGKNLSDLKENDEVGGFTVKDKKTTEAKTDNETSVTTTVTFEKVVEGEAESAPLSSGELGVILGVTLTEHQDEQGAVYYTYVKDGADVTVRVTSDESSQSSTTTYSIQVSQTTTTVAAKEEEENVQIQTGGVIIYDSTNAGDVEKIKALFSNSTVTENADGTKTVVKDGKTYTVQYEDLMDGEFEKLTNEQIIKLLPETGYAYDNGKIYKVEEDGTRYELTLAEAQNALVKKPVKVTVTVTNPQGGKENHDATQAEKDQAAADATNEAVINAVLEAIQADGLQDVDQENIKAQVQQDKDGNKSWTVTVTGADGKIYTYTVRANETTDGGETAWEVNKENIQDYVDGSGKTHTVNGSAYVSGETVVWSGSEDPSETYTEYFTKTETGVELQNFHPNGTLNGATIQTVFVNDDVTTVTTQTKTKDENGNDVVTTKVYTFTTGVALTDAEKAAFLKSQGAEGADLQGLTKVTWTIDVKTEVTAPEGKEEVETIVKVDGLTQAADGGYDYRDGNKKIHFNKGETSYTDGDTTYTIETAETTLTEDQVRAMVKEQYDLGDGVTVTVDTDNQTASYNQDGKTITVKYQNPKTLTVKKAVTTKETRKEVATATTDQEAKNALLEKIKTVVQAATDAGKQVSIEIAGTEYVLSFQNGQLVGFEDGELEGTQKGGMEIVEWIAENTAVNFDANDQEALKQYLQNLEAADKKSYMLHAHLDLLSGTTLNEEGSDETEDCVILGGSSLSVKVSKDIDNLLAEEPANWTTKTAKFQDNISFDPQTSEGFSQYQRGAGQSEVLGPLSGQGQGGYYTWDEGTQDWKFIKDNRYMQTSAYNFYKVEGQVAYGLYKDETYADGLIDFGYDWKDREGKRAKAAAEQIVQELRKNEETKYAVAVRFVRKDRVDGEDRDIVYYKVYKNVAALEAYGYLGEKNNACTTNNRNQRGYDLKLDNLTLLKDGKKVVASGSGTYSYAANLITKTTATTTKASGSSLQVGKITTTGADDGGDALAGSWTITQEKTVTTPGGEGGEDSYRYNGTGSGAYDSYQTWTSKEDPFASATYTEYGGTLAFNYTKPETVTTDEANIDWSNSTKTVVNVRDVDAQLNSTTVSTNTSKDDPTTVVTPDDPGPDTPEDPDTPDDPDDDDDDDDTDIPDEDVPLTDVPDGEVPLTDIPEEEVPLTDIPEEEVPLTDIPDEEVPLADVPRTGDSFLLEALAAMSSGASALWLALNKKRRG